MLSQHKSTHQEHERQPWGRTWLLLQWCKLVIQMIKDLNTNVNERNKQTTLDEFFCGNLVWIGPILNLLAQHLASQKWFNVSFTFGWFRSIFNPFYSALGQSDIVHYYSYVKWWSSYEDHHIVIWWSSYHHFIIQHLASLRWFTITRSTPLRTLCHNRFTINIPKLAIADIIDVIIMTLSSITHFLFVIYYHLHSLIISS